LLAAEPVDDAVIDAGLAPLWRAPTLDTVVLGCTHFPLLRDRLDARAPRPLQWVDSGSAIARRVAQVAGAVEENRPEHLAPAWATDPRPAGLTHGFRAFGFAPPVALSVPLPQPV
ncbi:MAG TPA: glutamate racemase, partial [Alcanivorax sp.]|nr:glutamate racemase [Alcanivorax sp.]